MCSIWCSKLRVNEVSTWQTILSSFSKPRFTAGIRCACLMEAIFHFMSFIQGCFTVSPRIDFCTFVQSCDWEATYHYYRSLIFLVSLEFYRRLPLSCDCHICPATSCVDPIRPSLFQNNFFLDHKDFLSWVETKSCFSCGLVQRGEKEHRVGGRWRDSLKAVQLVFVLSFGWTFR